MNLRLLDPRFSICRLEPGADVARWAWSGPLCAVVRTERELTVVTSEADVPADVARRVDGWRALELEGTYDLSQVGILAALTESLAAAAVSVFAVSTYDTDYLLVPESGLPRAVAALRDAGHVVTETA